METQTVQSVDETNVNETNVVEQLDEMDPSEYKYTKIDCLDEDPPVNGQTYVLLSFVSPERVMNCKVRGLKVRGVYSTMDEAKKAVEKLSKVDKYFDTYVAEVGKWLPWDPTPDQVKETKYRNKKLDKIMKSVHERELETLNELVGRKKESLDDSTRAHKDRVKESLKTTVANMQTKDETLATEQTNSSTEQTNTKSEKSEQKTMKSVNHDGSAVKDRLRKMIADKKKNQSQSVKSSEQSTSVDGQVRVKPRSSDVENRLARMKAEMNSK